MKRNRKKKKRKLRFVRYTIMSLVVISTYSFYQKIEPIGFINSGNLIEKEDVKEPSLPETVIPEINRNRVDLSKTNSPNVILLDFQTGETVAEKASSEIVFPASLTKIMTVAVALDYLTDFDQEIIMQEEYFEGLFEARASISGFEAGEKTTVRELLYGAILPSGADACLALAYLIAGSEADYVALMNQKAIELGMTRTHYANATGLHDPENISSVADIAKLVLTALQNSTFYEVFTTLQHEVPATNYNNEGFIMNSTIFNPLLKLPELKGLMIGGKTGFTEQAGLCLASLAQIDGKKYVLVTAGADAIPDFPVDQDRHIEEPLHIQDAANIYRQLAEGVDHVFDN
ncbi:D-alanyl-D-alanine carboxypeptidase family protein [Jeotgalibaca sp. A122]|uniref:D-alanyl-D-alanine carboxypeptidase family protein n=1 Tax=Jeotgalibaca sp. A122 TaxID=3457322 RepID=UPI003FD08A3D